MPSTFYGGIKLRTPNRTKKYPSEPMYPDSITLHIPHEYELCAAIGTKMLIGDTAGHCASGDKPDILCGISGTVSDIKQTPDGYSVKIDSDFLNTPSPRHSAFTKSISETSPQELIEALHSKGVPLPKTTGAALKFMIIPCAEDDSFMSSTAGLLLANPDAVIGGAKILMKIYGVRKCICAVSSDMTDCADALERHLPQKRMITIKILKNKYPRTDPRLLVSALFNLEINTGVDVVSAGYLTLSPKICAATYFALAAGAPYTAEIVTVGGNCTDFMGNLIIPFSTSFKNIIDYCGGLTVKPDRILDGGGMTGRIIENLDEVTTPETGGMTALREKTEGLYYPKSQKICIGCGKCDSVCPMRLTPSYLSEAARLGDRKRCIKLNIDSCTGCGCCSAVCPGGVDVAADIAGMIDYIGNITGEGVDSNG